MSREKYRKKAFMINKIITNVVLGSTFLGGGMIGLTTYPLAAAKPPKELPTYDDEATKKLKALRLNMDLKKCMEFLRGEGKNADPNVSVGGVDRLSSSGRLYSGITLLEEAILHGSLEDVRMLANSKNIRGIDRRVRGFDPNYKPMQGGPKYVHTLMHTAVASPQEMEKRWNVQFRAIKSVKGRDANLSSLEKHKPSDLHASAEIVQCLIDAFKKREKEWVLKVNEKDPKGNRDKKTTPLDLVKDYLNPKNVENYRGKERESYEKHKEEYMRIRDLLQKTEDDLRESGGSRGYQIYMMSLH
jgi:hypothetical protein